MEYPVNLRLEGRRCMVVGGGSVAERKVESLLQAGALVTVISPDLTPVLKDRVVRAEIEWSQRGFAAGDLTDAFIVIGATNDSEVNRAVAAEARQRGALVNIVDTPALCDFTVPAQVQRGDLVLTVSTNGKSPVFSRRIREEMEELYGPEYGQFLILVSRLRADIKQKLAGSGERELFWREALDREIMNFLRQGMLEEAEERLQNVVSRIGTES